MSLAELFSLRGRVALVTGASRGLGQAFAAALAAEWAPHNINVIALAPGYYGTTPNLRWFNSNPEIQRKVLELIPQGRLGDMRELAALVVVLASDVSNYMTGSVVLIDGGYTLR